MPEPSAGQSESRDTAPPMIFLNGSLIPSDEASVDPADRGFLLGDGIFETLLARDGRVAFLDRHLARLRASASSLGIPVPLADSEIEQAMRDLLEANRLTTSEASLRLTLSRGPGPRGLLPAEPDHQKPALMITAFRRDAGDLPPASLHLASLRVLSSSPLRRHKSLSYLENVLARREAKAAGADEALILNEASNVAEASAANLFMLEEGRLLTPRIEDGALPGITRGLVLEIAGEMGIEVAEASIDLEQLVAAEAIFLTNSLIGLRSVARLGGVASSSGREKRSMPVRWAVASQTVARLVAAYAACLEGAECAGSAT